jgi:hypothetical protein
MGYTEAFKVCGSARVLGEVCEHTDLGVYYANIQASAMEAAASSSSTVFSCCESEYMRFDNPRHALSTSESDN